MPRYAEVSRLLLDNRLGPRSSEAATSDLDPAELATVTALEELFRRWLVFDDGPTVATLRSAFTHSLNAAALREWQAQLTGLAAQHATAIHEPGAELVTSFVEPYVTAAVSRLLGIAAEHQDPVAAWGRELVGYLALDRYRADVVATADRALRDLRSYFVTTYLRDGSGPLARRFVDLLKSGTADPEDLLAVFTQMLTGGLEPTCTALAHGMTLGTDDPQFLTAFRHDPPAVVDEVLRLACPFHFAPRTALADIKVGEDVIPRGARVILVLASANRDTEAYDDPDLVSQVRPRRSHLTFGRGLHYCLGARAAREILRAGLDSVDEAFGRNWPGVAAVWVRSPSMSRVTSLRIAT